MLTLNKFLHIVSVSLLLTLNRLHTSVPYPDVFWYCLKGMGAQKNAPKKVLVTLFPLSYNYWGLSLNYPILNFKKTVCPKNVSMRHCTWLYKFEKISHIALLSVLLTLNKFYATCYFVIVNFEQILCCIVFIANFEPIFYIVFIVNFEKKSQNILVSLLLTNFSYFSIVNFEQISHIVSVSLNLALTQPAFTCSMLTKQGVKYVQS